MSSNPIDFIRMANCVALANLTEGLPHTLPGPELQEPAADSAEGCNGPARGQAAPKGRWDAQRPGAVGGANPKRTACQPPPRPEMYEQEPAGQRVRRDISHQQPSACFLVRDEEADDARAPRSRADASREVPYPYRCVEAAGDDYRAAVELRGRD